MSSELNSLNMNCIGIDDSNVCLRGLRKILTEYGVSFRSIDGSQPPSEIQKSLKNTLKHNENKIFRFIIDINLSRDNMNDASGLDLVELVKDARPNDRVTVITSHQKYRHQATKLGADEVIIKSADIEADAHDYINREISNITKHMDEFFSTHENESQWDINIRAMDKYLKDKNFVESYKGKYVALIDGVLMGENEDEAKLLNSLKQVDSKDKEVFIEKVGEKIPNEYISPALFFMDK